MNKLDTIEKFHKLATLMRHYHQVSVGTYASQNEVELAEARLQLTFPLSYKCFLIEFGTGGWPEIIYGLGLGGKKGLDVVYQTEQERSLVEPAIPMMLVPFSPDGWGNHHCLDTSAMLDDECPVVFWDHELPGSQHPQIEHDTFLDWLEKVVNEEIAAEY